jgi:hypothetical protein
MFGDNNNNGNNGNGGNVVDLSQLRLPEFDPESLPSFPALARQIDGVMNRLPWWAVMLATAFAARWWMKSR